MIGDLYIYSNTYNGDTNIIDLSSNNFTITKTGLPYHTTTYTNNTPVVNSSIYLNTDSTISINTNLNVGLNDFTFDIYTTFFQNYSGSILSLFSIGSSKITVKLEMVNINTYLKLYVNNDLVFTELLWYQKNLLTITRQNGIFKLYFDGVLKHVVNGYTTLDMGNNILLSFNSINLSCAINTIRFINGTCLYVTDFNMPTFPYTSDTNNNITGYVTENNNNVIRTIRLYNRETGALVYTTTSNADGSYAIPISDTTIEYDVVFLDDSSGIMYNDIIKRTSLI